jgi:hypothetical protein
LDAALEEFSFANSTNESAGTPGVIMTSRKADPFALSNRAFGLAAGLCIGALIAANFAMLAAEEKQEQHAVAHQHAHAHA